MVWRIGPRGRLTSRPPSAAQCERVVLAKSLMSTWLESASAAVKGTYDGSKATGKEALLRAASARAAPLGSPVP